MKIISDITAIETIAEGHGIHELNNLRQHYGQGYWRKKKGIALIESMNKEIKLAEIHWYEAHGIGRVKFKIKRWL